MKKEGLVSLWLGESESFSRLSSFLKINFNEDGESQGSEFLLNLGLRYFDEDFLEYERIEPTSFVDEILDGFSYDEIIKPQFRRALGSFLEQEVNTVVLLYNFQYSGENRSSSAPGVSLRYMGSVEYKS